VLITVPIPMLRKAALASRMTGFDQCSYCVGSLEFAEYNFTFDLLSPCDDQLS
jgi:hypothetical protein